MLRICVNYTGYNSDLQLAPLLGQYGMLRADQIYNFRLLQIIHKNKTQLVDNELDRTYYSLRIWNQHTPRTRTNYGKQMLSYQTITVLNKLSDQIDYHVFIRKLSSQISPKKEHSLFLSPKVPFACLYDVFLLSFSFPSFFFSFWRIPNIEFCI